MYWTLILEGHRETETNHAFQRMTVTADSKKEAIAAMDEIVSGKIDTSKLPKTGLDTRKKKEDEKNT